MDHQTAITKAILFPGDGYKKPVTFHTITDMITTLKFIHSINIATNTSEILQGYGYYNC